MVLSNKQDNSIHLDENMLRNAQKRVYQSTQMLVDSWEKYNFSLFHILTGKNAHTQ